MGVEVRFSFSFDNFLNQIFSVVQLFAVIFYLDLDWEPEFILEKTNQVKPIQAIVIKF